MKAINSGGVVDEPYPIEDTLFFKIQGDEDSIRRTAETIQEIIKKYGSRKFEFAATDEAAETMWQNRKYALIATLSSMPGYRNVLTDVW